jgi:hypothetical protein
MFSPLVCSFVDWRFVVWFDVLDKFHHFVFENTGLFEYWKCSIFTHPIIIIMIIAFNYIIERMQLQVNEFSALRERVNHITSTQINRTPPLLVVSVNCSALYSPQSNILQSLFLFVDCLNI